MLFLSYLDSQNRSLAFSIVDVSTGNVWSPAASAFVPPSPAAPAVAPADALLPLTRMAGANWSTILLGYEPNLPDAPSPGRYLAYIHPAAGGPPVDTLAIASPAPRTVSVAVSFP